MDRKERIEMDLAILEAARHVWLEPWGDMTFRQIHELIKAHIPLRFKGEEDWRTDYDALYDAEERFFASGEYKDTSRNRSLFSAGWSAAKDHYKTEHRNPGDGQ